MIQNLDVISVNLWQMVISLVNLLLLFLILKKFLFKPVKRIFEKRESELEERYDAAAEAQSKADEARRVFEEKLSHADAEAKEILERANENAKFRGERLVAEAKERAEGIVRVAQTEAALERKKAEDAIKREIVEVSGVLTEKMLAREINTEDHRALIDSVIEEMGESDD